MKNSTKAKLQGLTICVLVAASMSAMAASKNIIDVRDHYREVVYLEPYTVEVCSEQEVVIWIEIYIDLINSQSLTDSIEDTLDYDEINSKVKFIVNTKHYSLQETLIDKIAGFWVSLPGVKAARVKTAKTQAYENCKAVGIEVFKWK